MEHALRWEGSRVTGDKEGEFSREMKGHTHAADRDAWNNHWYYFPPIFQVLRCRLWSVPYKVAETPCQLDRGPSVHQEQLLGYKTSQDCPYRHIKTSRLTKTAIIWFIDYRICTQDFPITTYLI
mgnify:CR=1 FL=1